MGTRRILAAGAAIVGLLVAACGGASSSGGAPAGAGPASSSTAKASAVSFAGKTVTLVSGFAAGGPTDLFDRLLAKYLPQYLPGHPTVIVNDMTGAGGEIASNYVFRTAKPDGTTMLATSDPLTAWVLKDQGAQYDASQFVWVGGVPEADVQFVRTSTGIKSVADLRGYTGTLVFGGFAPSSNKDLQNRLYLDLLGVKYKYVTGYSGDATVNQAVRSGEVTFADSSISGYNTGDLPMQKQGLIAPLSQSGLTNAQGQIVADPRSPLPTDAQVIREVTGKAPSGTTYDALVAMTSSHDLLKSLALPPHTPAPVADAWRQAVAQVFKDPGFIAAAQKEFQEKLLLTPAAEAQQVVAHIASVMQRNPAALALVQKMAQIKPH
jgi:tripartite-type tricarboxylate transporter receptor subunit TctC